MRAVVAKRLRKLVWGEDGAPRERKYFIANRFNSKSMPKCLHGCCVADQKRRDYQHLKKEYQSQNA